MDVNDQNPEALADFLRGGNVFVLTGAGMSTDSGIPDYRRPDGSRRAIPMTFAQFCADESARRRYWIRSTVGWERFAAAQPNEGHRALAQWQRQGYVSRLVTQNVDGLHAAAGSSNVVELHGNLDVVHCLACDLRFPRATFQKELHRANPGLPRALALLADGDAEVDPAWEAGFVIAPCPRCGSTFIKPDVVMFGETVEPWVVADCFASLARARAILVLGSSLKVMSGYRFVLAAQKAGQSVALLGLGQMRGEDRADLVLKAPLTPLLSRTTTLLSGEREQAGSDPA